MKTWLKISIWTAIALVVIGFISWRLYASTVKPVVKTMEVTRQTIVKDIAFTGKTEPIESANLAFEIGGVIKHVYVKVGDTVAKGQVLAELDPQNVSSVEQVLLQKAVQTRLNTLAENAQLLEQRKQTVRDAKVALDQSKTVYNTKADESGNDSSTAQLAYSTIIANQGAYNSAQQTLTTTRKTIATANDAVIKAEEIAKTQLQVNMKKVFIRAPFKGIITQKNNAVGEFVGPGSTVIQLAITNSLQLSSDVPETDALALQDNMTASITYDALPNSPQSKAHISQIYPSAITIQGVPTFHVICTLENPSGTVRPGITANITVHAEKKENVLAIPRRAITIKLGKKYVRIQDAQKNSVETEVQTGLTGSDGLQEITSGIQEGDILIIP